MVRRERKEARNAEWERLHVEEGWTLAEVGREYGVSGERVRQVVRRRGVPESVTRDISVRAYTEDVLIAHLRRLARALGRTPTQGEVKAAEGPCPTTYVRRFGSTRAAQEAAGLAPNRRGRPAGGGGA